MQGEKNKNVFNMLPVLNESFAKEIRLGNCPLPHHYSTLSGKFPNVTFPMLGELNSGDIVGFDFFDEVTVITNLSLYGNELVSLDRRVFNNLRSLEKIDLSFNDFTELPSNIFANNSNLKHFMSEYNLNEFKPTRGLLANKKKLQVVSFAYSKIERIPTGVFHNSPNILEINLAHNKLEGLMRWDANIHQHFQKLLVHF